MKKYIRISFTQKNKLLSTERNNFVTLQYERFLNLREDFMCTLYDFKCMLLSATVQDVETKGSPVNLTAFSY